MCSAFWRAQDRVGKLYKHVYYVNRHNVKRFAADGEESLHGPSSLRRILQSGTRRVKLLIHENST